MKIAIALSGLIVLLGCQTKSPPQEKAATAQANATTAEAKPAVVALKTDEILACDRRSVLYDPSQHKHVEPVFPKAMTMRPGDVGYVNMLVSAGGRVYVNGYTQVHEKQDDQNTLMVKRATEGFLVDCDSPELDLWLNEGSESPASISDLIPVVGHIDVKRKK